MSSFTGRKRELAQVRGLLAAGVRLVTLTGVGGVGKTRLALRAALSVRRGFPDGVWLAGLSELGDESLLPVTVAEVLGVQARSAACPLGVLADYLGDKALLLMLDNCEHLTRGCAVLTTRLLERAPGLRVLATSRRRLGCEGEHVFVVPPLPVPAPDRLPLPEELTASPAVRLFTDRAQAGVAGFRITAGNRVAVAEVCRRLDGLPLAIELAAARVRVLSPEQMLDRLDDRFRLLTTGYRTAPHRHQTLRLAFDWSYTLCSPTEQVLWARASVFAGGFDLDAAEQVCAGEGIPSADVVDLVTALVDDSVLIGEQDGQSARYRMLETVRHYGRERLAASGEEAAVRAHHRDFYLGLAEQTAADMFSPREADALTRLDRDLPEMRLALELSLSQPGQARTALRMAIALGIPWVAGGRYQEGRRWLLRTLEANPEPSVDRALALAYCARAAANLVDLDTALTLAAEANALGKRLRCPTAVAYAAQTRATAALYRSDFPNALRLLEEALCIHRATGYARGACNTLLAMTAVGTLAGDPRAASFGEEAVALARVHGARRTRAWALTLLAFHHYRQGDRDRAAAGLRHALRSFRAAADCVGPGLTLEMLGWHEAAAGHHQRAATLLGASHRIWQVTGSHLGERGPFRPYHEAAERAARAGLGEGPYADAFGHGAQLEQAEATAYALGETRLPRSAARSHPQAGAIPLTRREHEIAGITAEGLTDRQIAARLGISERTVSSHVAHILAKLDFTSRSQIAAWVAGRPPPEDHP